jgi:2-C-methyl-D-erythritol 2,4-cyclodiphosphate synthase
MCQAGSIRDSREYVKAALETLGASHLVHLSFSIECKRPKITPFIGLMRKNIAEATCLSEDSIGITATSGEGLTDFGRGLGIQVLCIATARREVV